MTPFFFEPVYLKKFSVNGRWIICGHFQYILFLPTPLNPTIPDPFATSLPPGSQLVTSRSLLGFKWKIRAFYRNKICFDIFTTNCYVINWSIHVLCFARYILSGFPVSFCVTLLVREENYKPQDGNPRHFYCD